MKNRRDISPPKWANRLLKLYCKPEFLEEIQGDIYELFQERVKDGSLIKAKVKFIWDVFRFFKWSNIKRVKQKEIIGIQMFQNNIKIAFRAFSRQKLFTLINTFSLTLGIAGICLIYLFIQDELSFDKFHEKQDQIQRVLVDYLEPDGSIDKTVAYRPLPLGPALQRDFPEIESFVRVSRQELYVKQEQNIQEEDVLFADSNLFSVFSFPLLHGDPKQVLGQLKSVVISERIASKYFNKTDVVGESFFMMLQDKFIEYQITGVAKNTPFNSSVRFDILTAYSELPYYSYYKDKWSLSTDETYVLVNENVDLTALNAKVSDQWKVYSPGLEELIATGEEPQEQYRLQPLVEVHLDASVLSATATSDPKYSFILGGIAVVILLIACANFTTLSIARSASRAKEVGVRKVVGARQGQLGNQFLLEALLLSFLSLIISILLVKGLLPTFNTLTDKNLDFAQMFQLETMGLLCAITILSGLLAGFYPSIVLSRLKVVDVFKRKIKLGGANTFTKVLVSAQFAMSILLITGTLVMIQQLSFVKNKDLGFKGENVIVIDNELKNDLGRLQQLENSYSANPNVLNVTKTSSSFTKGSFSSSYVHDGTETPYTMFRIEPDYFETLEIKLLKGRNFNPEMLTDSSAVIINEALMAELGPDFQLGDRLVGLENGGLEEPIVIGVTNDYHFESLTEQLKPTILMINSFAGFAQILVKVTPGQSRQMLSELEKSWYAIAPDVPFTASLLNEDMERQYANEDRWAQIISYSAYLAISVALLGLLGLVSLAVVGRSKEIGIRKILGAHLYHIFFLVFGQFRIMMLLGLFISIPISFYILNLWLDSFAYHIDINPIVYPLIGLGIMGLIAIIVLGKTISVSKSNPVNSLRLE